MCFPLICQSDGVAYPVTLRYARTNNPWTSLFNGLGLPTTPFPLDSK